MSLQEILRMKTPLRLEYLGLTLDYTKKGQVKISIYEYVRKLEENAPEDMMGTA